MFGERDGKELEIFKKQNRCLSERNKDVGDRNGNRTWN